jgi:hypothetical protein
MHMLHSLNFYAYDSYCAKAYAMVGDGCGRNFYATCVQVSMHHVLIWRRSSVWSSEIYLVLSMVSMHIKVEEGTWTCAQMHIYYSASCCLVRGGYLNMCTNACARTAYLLVSRFSDSFQLYLTTKFYQNNCSVCPDLQDSTLLANGVGSESINTRSDHLVAS